MANFMGGSAPAMAGQISEGYILLNANTLKGYTPGELGLLRTELDKLLRDTRGLVPPQDDPLAQQARHRKIGRINSAIQVISHQMSNR
jgi:hypothetical protein